MKRADPLRKLRPETLNNLRDALRHLAERGRDSATLYGVTPLPESYVWGDALLHAHLSPVDICGGNTANLCAIFKCRSEGNPIIRGRFGIDPEANRITRRLAADNLQQPMFVGVVEFVKEIQGVVLAEILSSIWLQPLDSCLMALVKRLNHSSPATGEVGRLILAPSSTPANPLLEKDGELGSCKCLFACNVEYAQLVDKTIEGRAEMVGDFTDTEAQIQWRDNVHKSAERILSGLRIQLGWDNSIVGMCPELSIGDSESFDVTFCTPDLEAWAIERMHDLNERYGKNLKN